MFPLTIIKKEGTFMLMAGNIFSEKRKKRSPIREENPYCKKVEDRIEELKRKTLIKYYLHGGF
jgi:hypothetical protein